MPEFQGPTGGPPELRKLKTVTSHQLLTMEFPPRKNLLDPWLPQHRCADRDTHELWAACAK